MSEGWLLPKVGVLGVPHDSKAGRGWVLTSKSPISLYESQESLAGLVKAHIPKEILDCNKLAFSNKQKKSVEQFPTIPIHRVLIDLNLA